MIVFSLTLGEIISIVVWFLVLIANMVKYKTSG